MPNWVTAKLTVSGENADKVIKQFLTENEDGNLSFDFNKILPMPKELEIISGSTTDRAVEIYLTSINPNIDYYGEHKVEKKVFQNIFNLANSIKHFKKFRCDLSESEIKELIPHVLDEELKTEKDIIEYGRKAIDNVLKHNAMDWYDWSVNNWNTKWNACHTIYDEATPNIVYFDTAWSDVRELIRKMSEIVGKNTLEYAYSEEQIGLYTGVAEFKNGKVLQNTEYKDNSKEAYELAFELWGESLKDDYRYDERTKTYKYIDDEEDGGME